MFAAGIDVKVIQERVGHSGSKMTRDYAAVGEEVSRAATDLDQRVPEQRDLPRPLQPP